MKQCTKNRMKNKPIQSELDIAQIKKYNEDDRNHRKSNQHFVDILKQKDICAAQGCGKIMYFGNESDVMEFCDVANKVSPDRRDNQNIFYEDDNFDLVCQTCNYTENRAGRTYFKNKVENDAIFFTCELFQQCLEWLEV